MNVIEKLGRFLDPIIAVRRDDGYWTPNGNHRLQAMRKLGAKSIDRAGRARARRRLQDPRAQHREGAQPQGEVARGDPDAAGAGRRAASSRDRARVRVRVRAAGLPDARRGLRSSGRASAAAPTSRSCAASTTSSTSRCRSALEERTRRAALILEIDDAVGAIVDKLKKRGFTSPYLRPFVVARINPIRFSKSTEFDFDDVLGADAEERGEVQRRARAAGGRRPRRRRADRRQCSSRRSPVTSTHPRCLQE